MSGRKGGGRASRPESGENAPIIPLVPPHPRPPPLQEQVEDLEAMKKRDDEIAAKAAEAAEAAAAEAAAEPPKEGEEVSLFSYLLHTHRGRTIHHRLTQPHPSSLRLLPLPPLRTPPLPLPSPCRQSSRPSRRLLVLLRRPFSARPLSFPQSPPPPRLSTSSRPTVMPSRLLMPTLPWSLVASQGTASTTWHWS